MVDMYDVWQWFQDYGEDLTFSMAGLNGFIRAADAATDFAMDTTRVTNTGVTMMGATNMNVGQDISDNHHRKNPVTTNAVGINPIPLHRRQDNHNSHIADSGVDTGGGGVGVGDGAVVPSLRQLSGYDTTTHAKNNDVKSQWVAFTPQDC